MAQIDATFKDRRGTEVTVSADPTRDAVAIQAYNSARAQYEVFVIDTHTAKRLGEFLAGLED